MDEKKTVICKHCGNETDAGSDHCPKCGMTIFRRENAAPSSMSATDIALMKRAQAKKEEEIARREEELKRRE